MRPDMCGRSIGASIADAGDTVEAMAVGGNRVVRHQAATTDTLDKLSHCLRRHAKHRRLPIALTLSLEI